MSWLFSQALVAEYSAATSSDGARSALSSSSPTPQAYLPQDKMTAFSRRSRFGMTFAPLTDGLGKDLLTWFLADSRVRTYQLLAKAPVSMASAPDCGEKWHGSFAKYSHATSSWKTAQCSLLAGSDEFSETWPKWGMAKNGAAYPLPTLVHTMREKGYGLWPTPQARDYRSGDHPEGKRAKRKQAQGWSINLNDAVRKWPMPTASMSKGSSPATLTRKSGADRTNDRLDHAVMASDGGQLNPTWVEWLMGWPQGWTDLKPLEMGKFHEWQRQHSPCSAKSEVAA